jgi:hypothetical protein
VDVVGHCIVPDRPAASLSSFLVNDFERSAT